MCRSGLPAVTKLLQAQTTNSAKHPLRIFIT